MKLGHCSGKGFSWIKVMEGIKWDLDEFPKHIYMPFSCVLFPVRWAKSEVSA